MNEEWKNKLDQLVLRLRAAETAWLGHRPTPPPQRWNLTDDHVSNVCSAIENTRFILYGDLHRRLRLKDTSGIGQCHELEYHPGQLSSQHALYESGDTLILAMKPSLFS